MSSAESATIGPRVIIVFGVVLSLTIVTACNSANEPAAVDPGSDTGDAMAAGMTFPKNADGYADITVDQLRGMMSDKDFTLVNVHVPYDGELPETDLFIAYDQIGDQLDALPARDAPIVIYCRSGNMSTQSAAQLAQLGYTNVMELDGGFNAWRNAGYGVLNEPR